jgi:hypothetical protein
MSQVTLQGNASGTGVFTVAAPNSNTSRTLTLPDATGTVVTTDATQTLTNKSISGAQINSGTVAVARLGSGTPGTGNFLRGDGSWQTVPAPAPPTGLDEVGTYTFAIYGVTLPGNVATQHHFLARGTTIAGSSLRVTSRGTINNVTTNSSSDIVNGTRIGLQNNTPFPTGNSTTLPGTWRLMDNGHWATTQASGYNFLPTWRSLLWVRIS